MNSFSFCNHCYKKIPAAITLSDDGVRLVKYCCGKEQSEIIEKDVNFYSLIRSMPFNNILGNSCAINITGKCNTTCVACYSKRTKTEKSINEIMGLARSAPLWVRKFILTGGEPTTHSHFFDIVNQLDCSIITNGLKFADANFLNEYCGHKVFWKKDELAMMFSLNVPGSKDYDKKMTALENIRSKGLRVSIISVTIKDINQLPVVMDHFNKLKDVGVCFKIRSAFNIGQADGFKHIYISELFKYMKDNHKQVDFIEGLHTHTYLVNVMVDGMHILLIKCPDKTTIDLVNIGPCGPYIYTKVDGFENFMAGLIVDEGIDKGFLNGKRIANG